MNVTSSRSVVTVGRIEPTTTALAGATTPPEQLARVAALIAPGTIEAARRSTAAKRGANLTMLESHVRGGRYAPDATLVASEMVGDAQITAGLRGFAAARGR